MIAPAALSAALAVAQVQSLLASGEAGQAFALLTARLDDEGIAPGDPAVAFDARLLRYLRCEDPGAPPSAELLAGEPGYRVAHSLFAVEALRLHRRARERQPSGPEAWLADHRLRWNVPAPPASDDKTIRWSPTEERWSDEEPVVSAPAIACGKGEDGAQGKGAPKRRGRALLVEEAEAVRAMRLQLAPATPARVALFLDEAVLRARLAEWSEAWVLVRLLEEEAARPGAGTLEGPERIEHIFLAGLAAESEQRDADAEVRWERAEELPLSDEQRLFVDLHRQRILVANGRLAEAREVLERNAGQPGEVGRYLRFRAALVRFRMGDEAGLLAASRDLLGRRSMAQLAADPIGRATEELVYLMLAAHAMEPKLLEIVESLGPPNEVYKRADALATVAFDHGRAPLAAGLYGWLLEHHKLDYLRPYYLGRLAAAAAAQGDDATFAKSFHALVEEALRPPPGREPARPSTSTPPAVAPKRGGARAGAATARKETRRRNVEWDRQILLATRDAVAALAARRDAVGLRALTTDLQAYLRAVSDKPRYQEITRLYRLASTQLPRTARGYAETVGREHAPVWLGDVALDRPRTEVPEPELVPPPMYGPETLLCLPDAKGGCPRWLGPPPPSPSPATPSPSTAPRAEAEEVRSAR